MTLVAEAVVEDQVIIVGEITNTVKRRAMNCPIGLRPVYAPKPQRYIHSNS